MTKPAITPQTKTLIIITHPGGTIVRACALAQTNEMRRLAVASMGKTPHSVRVTNFTPNHAHPTATATQRKKHVARLAAQ